MNTAPSAIPLQWAPTGLPANPCTYWTCPSGHRWPTQLQIVGCPVCKQPFIALKLANCPICNEPPLRLRTIAVLAPSNTLTPPCQETSNAAQSVEIFIDHNPTTPSDPSARATDWATSTNGPQTPPLLPQGHPGPCPTCTPGAPANVQPPS